MYSFLVKHNCFVIQTHETHLFDWLFLFSSGSPAGLDLNAETLPNALKKRAGYRTAMSGKWHLGHSKKIQTPIGRGFDVFTGSELCF